MTTCPHCHQRSYGPPMDRYADGYCIHCGDVYRPVLTATEAQDDVVLAARVMLPKRYVCACGIERNSEIALSQHQRWCGRGYQSELAI